MQSTKVARFLNQSLVSSGDVIRSSEVARALHKQSVLGLTYYRVNSLNLAILLLFPAFCAKPVARVPDIVQLLHNAHSFRLEV
jgi:hypothetical protein